MHVSNIFCQSGEFWVQRWLNENQTHHYSTSASWMRTTIPMSNIQFPLFAFKKSTIFQQARNWIFGSLCFSVILSIFPFLCNVKGQYHVSKMCWSVLFILWQMLVGGPSEWDQGFGFFPPLLAHACIGLQGHLCVNVYGLSSNSSNKITAVLLVDCTIPGVPHLARKGNLTGWSLPWSLPGACPHFYKYMISV